MKNSILLSICLLLSCAFYVQAQEVPPENNSEFNTPQASQKAGKEANGKANAPKFPPKGFDKNGKPGQGKRPAPGGANRMHRFHDMSTLRQNDPELFKLISVDAELDRKVKELVRQYKSAKDEKQKENLRKKISESCQKHFEVRQQRRELELNRMKAWLNQMEEGVKKSRENSEKIIQQRVSNLLDNNLGEF